MLWTYLGAALESDPVAHVESAHELQHGDLQREVEWSDDRHRAVRPAVSLSRLPHVVAWCPEGLGQEAHLPQCGTVRSARPFERRYSARSD